MVNGAIPRHHAVGNLRLLIVPMPPFDPADEFEDPEQPPLASTTTEVSQRS